MLEIMADLDDNGCQRIGKVRRKLFRLLVRGESVEEGAAGTAGRATLS